MFHRQRPSRDGIAYIHVARRWSRPAPATGEALSRAFEKHQRRLAVLIHFRLPGGARHFDEVEDLVQETLFRAFRDLDRFTWQSPAVSSAGPLRSPPCGCRPGALSGGNGGPAKKSASARQQPGRSGTADSATPSRLLARKEAVERLLEQLYAFPDDYREALVMAKMEG